jgi:hypothetical protein
MYMYTHPKKIKAGFQNAICTLRFFAALFPMPRLGNTPITMHQKIKKM